MKVLRQAFESLGLSVVGTFLGSGNVVFETRGKNVKALEKKIERKLQEVLGYNVPVFIRTPVELRKIAAVEPFEEPQIRSADVNIILLADNLAEGPKSKLMAMQTKTDGFLVHGREIYWCRHKKPGTSIFSTVPLAKVLPGPFTIRGTNTIRGAGREVSVGSHRRMG